jgi:hypothetical protein
MHTIRLQHHQSLLPAQQVRLLDMFDGALPPEPPATAAPAAHDFLVLCLRPGDPPAPPAVQTAFRSAA